LDRRFELCQNFKSLLSFFLFIIYPKSSGRVNSHTTFNNNYYYYYYNFERNRNQHDFSSYISFRKKVTIGATYRTQFDPIWIGFVGVKLKEKLNLQFSFNVKKDKYDPRFWEALVQYAF